MIYDYIIVGGGVSGAVCSYRLAILGKKCLILEMKSIGDEKVCGGGIAKKALDRLKYIGMDVKQLYECETKIISGHILKKSDGSIKKTYLPGQEALGIQRCIFDGFLLNQALSKGVSICYGQRVDNILHTNDVYVVNGFKSKDIVWATGARSKQNKLLMGQSIGYRGQIYTNCFLDDSKFHFWYYDKNRRDKYFWAFPIGKKLWNVGIWCREYEKRIKNDYMECLDKFFLSKVECEWSYKRTPRAEFLGHIDQRINNSIFENGIGDFAGTCNVRNGGGIHYAIESAIEFCENI